MSYFTWKSGRPAHLASSQGQIRLGATEAPFSLISVQSRSSNFTCIVLALLPMIRDCNMLIVASSVRKMRGHILSLDVSTRVHCPRAWMNACVSGFRPQRGSRRQLSCSQGLDGGSGICYGIISALGNGNDTDTGNGNGFNQ